MTEIEEISREIHRLENRVIRAAVNRFYHSNLSNDAGDDTLEQNLSDAVDGLVAALPAIPFVKRDGQVQ